MYTGNDYKRQSEGKIGEAYRSPFRVDYARLLHSSAFRRLEGKTQLFPGIESDFFRNRLTHSLEVAQIAKSIALKLNLEQVELKSSPIDLDLVEFAALAHDLGHPPFGHNGEAALDELTCDVGGYEGNAQTLRVLTKIEKKHKQIWDKGPIDPSTHLDLRLGLNLTYRSIASILKYDNKIKLSCATRDKPEKGYYHFDEPLVSEIKYAVSGDRNKKNFKTVECSIMDIADDIAYSVYDLEDCLKAGFVSPLDFLSPDDALAEKIVQKLPSKVSLTVIDVKKNLYRIFQDFFEANINAVLEDYKTAGETDKLIAAVSQMYLGSRMLCRDGYYRTDFTSSIVKRMFDGIRFKFDTTNPALSEVFFEDETLKMVEVLKQYNYVRVINSSMLRVSEHRGKDIIKLLFDAIKKNPKLMPEDYQSIYQSVNEDMKARTIVDFIAGMTDRYAVEFYSRLYSENPESIFKPF